MAHKLTSNQSVIYNAERQASAILEITLNKLPIKMMVGIITM
jgi:hypothetical protein